MDWVSIIIALVSTLTGGGLISLLTIREQRKSLKIDNKAKEDDRWEKLANELQDENARLNERLDKKDSRITELEDTNSVLRTSLDEVRTKCAIAEILRCEAVACPNRQPPIGVRNLDVEKLITLEE